MYEAPENHTQYKGKAVMETQKRLKPFSQRALALDMRTPHSPHLLSPMHSFISHMKSLVFVVSAVLLGGCATPVSYTNFPLSTYDKDTEYGIERRDDGFGITVYYSRYQFIPESSAVATACKSQLTAIAWEHAEKAGRKIEPVNDQRIRISMGRNGVSGITSCQANAIVKWQ